MNGKLIIVGTGIQLGQLTLEAKSAIENAKKVLYLISDPTTENYVKQLNKTAESMIKFYAIGKERKQTYNEIIDYILKSLQQFKQLVVAFYGHPGVFTYPSHKAIEKARKMDFEAKMLPGISTEDMIVADLGIDPGMYGLQTFEATQLLRKNLIFDSRCLVVIWQIGVIGVTKHSEKPIIKEQLTSLKSILLQKYPKTHEIILYLAATHRMFTSTVLTIKLEDLDETDFDPISTLIIKPYIKES